MRPIKLTLGTVLIPYEVWEILRDKYSREKIRDLLIQEGLAAVLCLADTDEETEELD